MQLGLNAQSKIVRNHLGGTQTDTPYPRDKAVIHTEGALEGATPAHGAAIEALVHLVDHLFREVLGTHKLSQDLPREGMPFFEDLSDQIGTLCRQPVDVGLVFTGNMTLGRAVVAFRAGIEI